MIKRENNQDNQEKRYVKCKKLFFPYNSDSDDLYTPGMLVHILEQLYAQTVLPALGFSYYG